jgi:hypothetical protein
MAIIIEITLLDISYIRPDHQLTIEIGIFLGLVSLSILVQFIEYPVRHFIFLCYPTIILYYSIIDYTILITFYITYLLTLYTVPCTTIT